MKKLSTKSVLLFSALLAVCAFMAPMVSAASFAPVGTNHTLTSNDLGFTSSPGGIAIGSSCGDSSFTATIASASDLSITAASFNNCVGTVGVSAGCRITSVATGLPWTGTAVTTTNIQIHNVRVDVFFENPVGGSCAINGTAALWTGTLSSGSFDPSAIGANRRITFVNAAGLTSHGSGTATAVSMTGAFRDAAGTLNVFD